MVDPERKIISLREQQGVDEIPDDWFRGFRKRGQAIDQVGFNDIVLSVGDGYFFEAYFKWSETQYFAYGDPTKFDVSEYETVEFQAEQRDLIAPEEKFIQTYVGFSALELRDRKSKMQKDYIGKTTAPFPITVD